MAPDAPRCTRAATSCATCGSGTATRTPTADVVVTRRATRSGCRTRPSSARSPASRSPTARAASTSTSRRSGCTSTATRWPRASALPPEQVRLTLGGVGGAFGGREDLSMQVHACLLALRTGRPVKMVYSREESFVGHVHRHPARMRYEHGADRDGKLVYVQGADRARRRRVRVAARPPSCSNAACFAAGPYAVPNATHRRATSSTRTTRRAARCAASARSRSLRPRGADGQARRGAGHGPGRAADRATRCRPATRMLTGQVVAGPAPVAELLERLRALPLPARPPTARATCASCPAASPTRRTARACGAASATRSASRTSATPRASTTTRPRASGSRATSTASRSSRSTPRRPRSARASSPSRRRSRAPSSASSASWSLPTPTRAVGSAGSSSASRQTYITGGAVKAACEAVRERLRRALARAATLRRAAVERRPVEDDRRVPPPRRPHPLDPRRPGRRAPAVRASRPTARWSTSTSSSAWSGWSSSRRRRTSARRSTRRRSRASSRAASPRASAWR